MMVRCHTCSEEISSDTESCPHCGEPEPYTAVDARLDAAIHRRAERTLNHETFILLGAIGIGIVWGWAKGGAIGAFLGFVAGAIVGQVANKVMGWFT